MGSSKSPHENVERLDQRLNASLSMDKSRHETRELLVGSQRSINKQSSFVFPVAADYNDYRLVFYSVSLD